MWPSVVANSAEHMNTLTQAGGIGEFIIAPGLKRIKVTKVNPLTPKDWAIAEPLYFMKRPATAQ